jgi:hypothetical protein
VSTEKSHNVKQLPNWDLAIDESVRQLQESEARAARLRVCLDYFKGRKESGDPFPGIEILRQKWMSRASGAETTELGG